LPDSGFFKAVHPVSQTEELLSLLKRGGINTKLINLVGHQNALMQLYRTGLVSGLIVDTAETQDFTNPENAIDGMQEIITGSQSGQNINKFAHYDFGSIASRAVYWCTSLANTSGTSADGRWDLDTSDDKVSWTERDTWTRGVISSSTQTFPNTFQGRNIAAVSFRYLRLNWHALSGQGSMKGAISQLSTTAHFDDPTPALGAVVNANVKLQTLIDIGTLWKDLGGTGVLGQKFGQESKGEYGMQPNLTSTNLSAILPNDATHLRAHLEVIPSDAFIETGLSVQKV